MLWCSRLHQPRDLCLGRVAVAQHGDRHTARVNGERGIGACVFAVARQVDPIVDCEPLRASGKLLTVDKVLTVSQAAGPALFADPTWAADYAGAVFAALAKPVIRVDVPAMAITY